jgi:hypothetical protein
LSNLRSIVIGAIAGVVVVLGVFAVILVWRFKRSKSRSLVQFVDPQAQFAPNPLYALNVDRQEKQASWLFGLSVVDESLFYKDDEKGLSLPTSAETGIFYPLGGGREPASDCGNEQQVYAIPMATVSGFDNDHVYAVAQSNPEVLYDQRTMLLNSDKPPSSTMYAVPMNKEPLYCLAAHQVNPDFDV